MKDYVVDYAATCDVECDEDLYENEELHSLMVSEEKDPITYEETAKDEKWMKAMDSEMTSIEKNNTWGISQLSTRREKYWSQMDLQK